MCGEGEGVKEGGSELRGREGGEGRELKGSKGGRGREGKEGCSIVLIDVCMHGLYYFIFVFQLG